MSQRLSTKAGDHSKMRYPDMYSGQQIPADAYTRETAEEVMSISREII
jgi:HEPN domain-containing protein